MSTAFEVVLDQALRLPVEERGALAAQLLRSLGPEPGEELAGPEWEAAWSAEIERRVREVRDGTVELVEGDRVMAELRDLASGA